MQTGTKSIETGVHGAVCVNSRPASTAPVPTMVVMIATPISTIRFVSRPHPL